MWLFREREEESCGSKETKMDQQREDVKHTTTNFSDLPPNLFPFLFLFPKPKKKK